MTLKEFYEQIDSDYKDVIKRLCDENMIKKFVFKFPEDPSFNDLKDGLKENDAEKAFCAVHTSQFQVLCKPSLWCRIEIH